MTTAFAALSRLYIQWLIMQILVVSIAWREGLVERSGRNGTLGIETTSDNTVVTQT